MPQLHAPRLEASGLKLEVALGHPKHEPTLQAADQTPLVDLLADQRASAGLGDDFVAGKDQPAGGALHPGPGGARDHLGDFPHQPRQAGLLDLEPFADRDGGPVEADEVGDRGSPFGPALDVAEDLPHERC